jgi:uncharacterized protein (DUF952 family)
VRWVFPEDAEYIPICLPAFSPSNCHREEDASATPPSHDAHTDIYHLVQKPLWEQHKAAGSVYFPPTYEQDGFTHATSDPSKLLGVANHFYKDVQADWLCLKMTRATLAAAKLTLKFEAPAPVGTTAPLSPELSGRQSPARAIPRCRGLPRGCWLNGGSGYMRHNRWNEAMLHQPTHVSTVSSHRHRHLHRAAALRHYSDTTFKPPVPTHQVPQVPVPLLQQAKPPVLCEAAQQATC